MLRWPRWTCRSQGSWTMEEPTGNEFAEALRIVNGYYRAMVVPLAEEIIENAAEFEIPFLGRAESILETYAHPLRNLAEVHEILNLVGNALFREKLVHLRKDEYICFGCRAVLRK